MIGNRVNTRFAPFPLLNLFTLTPLFKRTPPEKRLNSIRERSTGFDEQSNYSTTSI